MKYYIKAEYIIKDKNVNEEEFVDHVFETQVRHNTKYMSDVLLSTSNSKNYMSTLIDTSSIYSAMQRMEDFCNFINTDRFNKKIVVEEKEETASKNFEISWRIILAQEEEDD